VVFPTPERPTIDTNPPVSTVKVTLSIIKEPL
jgi:hypothetical protein